jgi:hypothetical protein
MTNLKFIPESDSLFKHKKEILSLVSSAAAAHGWILSKNGSALAYKAFSTAVGEKKAYVYVLDHGLVTDGFTLSGEYWSENRNALEAHDAYFAKTSDAKAIDNTFFEYSRNVDKVVGETYAAKLFGLKNQTVES